MEAGDPSVSIDLLVSRSAPWLVLPILPKQFEEGRREQVLVRPRARARLSCLFGFSGLCGFFGSMNEQTNRTDRPPSALLVHLSTGPDNSEPRTHNSELPQTGGVISREERGILRRQ